MQRISFVALLALGGCTGLHGHDEFANYTERKDTMTMGAGDAVRQNAATHMLTPWPSYVGDRQIFVQADKAGKAVECYRVGKSQPTGGTTTTGSATSSGGTTTSSATSSPTMSKGC